MKRRLRNYSIDMNLMVTATQVWRYMYIWYHLYVYVYMHVYIYALAYAQNDEYIFM